MMLRDLGPVAAIADHVPAAMGMDALPYIAVVLLWLIGVIALVLRKLRAA